MPVVVLQEGVAVLKHGVAQEEGLLTDSPGRQDDEGVIGLRQNLGRPGKDGPPVVAKFGNGQVRNSPTIHSGRSILGACPRRRSCSWRMSPASSSHWGRKSAT